MFTHSVEVLNYATPCFGLNGLVALLNDAKFKWMQVPENDVFYIVNHRSLCCDLLSSSYISSEF